ncbi:hypothetical protein [Enterococcus rivorum]|uniref:Uncharacterized protein n=1 Tax=Enterococcus rivorum TaxID=762845 RepID=A0A1E5L073_9ENTE|nr:hypothetical protein [Enterococcus rivorum]MBP2099193.1 hypothetical protein [Enterococcus rivorum]OEH83483.1 hypothetical protein BCR26_09250 [Enterococcus rivorum]
MFISFNLFVLLILLTIVMIALIVFLTFTGGPSRKERQQKKAETLHSIPAHDENSATLIETTPDSTVTDVPFLRNKQPENNPSLPQANKPTYGGNDFYYISKESNPQKTDTVGEDDPFSILPYPKEQLDSHQSDKSHTE